MAVALELDDEDDGDHGEAEDDGVGHAVERVDPPVVEKVVRFEGCRRFRTGNVADSTLQNEFPCPSYTTLG